jgi:hypothetical protein
VIRSYTQLRKLIKASVYTAARLKPRTSDCDFGFDDVGGGAAGAMGEQRVITIAEAEATLEAELVDATAFSQYVAENKPEVSVDCHIAPTTMFNHLMVEIMPKLVPTTSTRDALLFVVEAMGSTYHNINMISWNQGA